MYGGGGNSPPVFLYNNIQNEKEDIHQRAAAVHGAKEAICERVPKSIG